MTIVLKVGGASTGGVAEAVAALHEPVCVVHGAGPQISDEMAKRGLEVLFVEGRRVTTPEVLEVVRESFAAVRSGICAAIGPAAVPLAGDEIGLEAEHVPELGLVGTPVPSAPEPIVRALAEGRIPVVAPLATGPLNLNADEAASALAVGLRAERILFVSDVPGLLLAGSLVGSIGADEAVELLETGGLEGGILPKLRAAVLAARRGVPAEIGETAVLA